MSNVERDGQAERDELVALSKSQNNIADALGAVTAQVRKKDRRQIVGRVLIGLMLALLLYRSVTGTNERNKQFQLGQDRASCQDALQRNVVGIIAEIVSIQPPILQKGEDTVAFAGRREAYLAKMGEKRDELSGARQLLAEHKPCIGDSPDPTPLDPSD